MKSDSAPRRSSPLQTTLLTAGVVSSLLYVAMNIFMPMQWPDYNWTSQTVSELSAIGSPTRPVWTVLAVIYVLLVGGFGIGVRMAAGENRRLKVVGTLIFIYGAFGLFWPPMHQRSLLAAGGGSFTDTMHLLWAAMTVLIMLSVLAVGATAMGRLFRLYSVITLVGMAAFGGLTGLNADRVGQDLPTPLIGVWERLSIGLFLLWVMVLAAALLQMGKDRTHVRSSVRH